MQEFDEPGVAIIKHTNPCGAATGATILEAYQKALAADPVSAFGSVIGINREVDWQPPRKLPSSLWKPLPRHRSRPKPGPASPRRRTFASCEVRPGPRPRASSKAGFGRLLLQDADHGRVDRRHGRDQAQARRRPSIAALLFAWRVCKHVKSNAIVYARNGQVLGSRRGPDEPR